MTGQGPDLPPLTRMKAPAPLVESVARRGGMLLRETSRAAARTRARKVVVDVGLAGFCLVHLAWCAHVVGLLP